MNVHTIQHIMYTYVYEPHGALFRYNLSAWILLMCWQQRAWGPTIGSSRHGLVIVAMIYRWHNRVWRLIVGENRRGTRFSLCTRMSCNHLEGSDFVGILDFANLS